MERDELHWEVSSERVERDGRRLPDRVQRRKGAAHASETHPAPAPVVPLRRGLPLLNRHQLFPKEWKRPAAVAGRSPFSAWLMGSAQEIQVGCNTIRIRKAGKQERANSALSC